MGTGQRGQSQLDVQLLLVTEVVSVLAGAAFLAWYVYPLLGIAVIGGWAGLNRQLTMSRRAAAERAEADRARAASRFGRPTAVPEPERPASAAPTSYRPQTNERE